MVFEVTESGAEALSFVESMLIDSKDQRALKRDAFGGFTAGELSVDAFDGGLTETLSPCNGPGADSLVMLLEDGLAEGLRSVSSF